jgi:prepilin-type N-terminal cleavage/methylation domain-containing protein
MGRRDGFTLIELMVALAVGAVVVLLAHRLFVGVADGARRMDAARAALDRDMNARRWLAEAFGSLDVGLGSGFVGRAEHVQFGAWLRTPEGWLIRRQVDLAMRHNRLVARLAADDSIVLADSVRQLQLDYLLEAGEDAGASGAMPGERASFVREWISPVSAPLAVRLRLARLAGSVDTLLLIIGPRG